MSQCDIIVVILPKNSKNNREPENRKKNKPKGSTVVLWHALKRIMTIKDQPIFVGTESRSENKTNIMAYNTYKINTVTLKKQNVQRNFWLL